jgi:hypothetical protein
MGRMDHTDDGDLQSPAEPGRGWLAMGIGPAGERRWGVHTDAHMHFFSEGLCSSVQQQNCNEARSAIGQRLCSCEHGG